MRQQQSGFTLIELIMVIVILGILAATAIPKFVDLSTDARQAATDGMAGALGAASAINLAAHTANTTYGVKVNSCFDIEPALEGGALPTDYSIQTDTLIADGSTANCTVEHTDGETATFLGHGVDW